MTLEGGPDGLCFPHFKAYLHSPLSPLFSSSSSMSSLSSININPPSSSQLPARFCPTQNKISLSLIHLYSNYPPSTSSHFGPTVWKTWTSTTSSPPNLSDLTICGLRIPVVNYTPVKLASAAGVCKVVLVLGTKG